MPSSIMHFVCLGVGLFLAACANPSQVISADENFITVASDSYDDAKAKADQHCLQYGKLANYMSSRVEGWFDFYCM